MNKVMIKKEAFCLPWTQTILGTAYHGKLNWMALDWLTRVNFQPPMLGICVGNGHASNAAIRETGEFSVNVPSTDMVEITDYVGIVSAKNADKSTLFEVFRGELTRAPMIAACPVAMECRVTKTVDLPSNTLFIADIVNVYTEERFLTDGKPDARKIRPFVLTMPDNRYWAVGDPIGNAWKAGVALRDRLEKEKKAHP